MHLTLCSDWQNDCPPHLFIGSRVEKYKWQTTCESGCCVSSIANRGGGLLSSQHQQLAIVRPPEWVIRGSLISGCCHLRVAVSLTSGCCQTSLDQKSKRQWRSWAWRSLVATANHQSGRLRMQAVAVIESLVGLARSVRASPFGGLKRYHMYEIK